MLLSTDSPASARHTEILPPLRPDTSLSAGDHGGPNPYGEYSRSLTPEGGVLFAYKDIDTRLRHMLWRIFVWSVATGAATAILLEVFSEAGFGTKTAFLLAGALIAWLIVRKPIEVHRTAEIRYDRLILDGTDIFWLKMMENGLPIFYEDDDGNLVLAGPYGTRFVEYLTARRFDDNDRTADVFVAHFEEAMAQLWEPSIALGRVRRGSPPTP